VIILGASVSALFAGAGCGGGTADCPGGCPECEECVYGVCVPEPGCDAGTDGGGDTVEPDGDVVREDTAVPDDGTGPDDGGEPDDAIRPDDGGEPDDAIRPDDGGREDAGPGEERCNGEDDDGDGLTDEGFPCALGAPALCVTSCGTTGVGACTAACELPTGAACTPPSETCNGADDDCDGACDDGFPCCAGTTIACPTWCGSTGTAVCGLGCALGTCTPPLETCNGTDDDCDGTCDEGFACCAGATLPCTTTCGSSGTATCTERCTVGATCTPPAETCNGVDDDCDTTVDEGCAANDTCATAAAYTMGTTVTGSTASSADDATPPCVTSGAGGRDVFHVFTSAAVSDVFCHSQGSGYDTVLYASATCGMGDLGCNDDVYYGYVTWSAVSLDNVPAGRTYVAVDGFYSTGGNYSLTCYQTPADDPTDRCGQPGLIPRPGSGSPTAQVSGNTCGLGDEYSASCVAGDGGEAVYYLALRDARTVTFSTCNTATVADTVIYVRNACTPTAADLHCNDNAGSTGTCSTITASLSPGIYYVFVDTPDSMLPVCGAFRLDVSGAW
jgi:hypothetical protein